MGLCFSKGCAMSADDANVTMPFYKADKEQTDGGIVTNDKLALFDFGMVWIGEDTGKWIGKHKDCIGERDPMLAKVGYGFALIPLEPHI
jgi:hypothetical protein